MDEQAFHERVQGTVRPVAGRAATQFKAGNRAACGVNRNGRGKGKPKPPRLLCDMRAVYAGTAPGANLGRQALARFLQNDPKGYLTRMAALEKAYLGKPATATKTPPGPPVAVDGGTRRALEIINGILEPDNETRRLRVRATGDEPAAEPPLWFPQE